MNGTQLRLLSSGSGLVTAIRMIVRLAIPSETPSLAALWGGGRPAGARVMAKARAIHPVRWWLDSLGSPALRQSTKTGQPAAAQSWLLPLAGSLGSAGRAQRECHHSRPGCGGWGGWGGSPRQTAGIEDYILRWAFVDTTPGGLRSYRRHL